MPYDSNDRQRAKFRAEIVALSAEIKRLRAALQAIADDPDTSIEATVYARNSIAGSLERVT